MSDEELAELSPREVIALVRQLEARLRAVAAELAAAQVCNTELEAELARRGGPPAAAYPAGFEPTRVFGPHLEALWTYLHEQHHVGYARLAALGRDLWHLAVSQGALANALRRVAIRLSPQAAVSTCSSSSMTRPCRRRTTPRSRRSATPWCIAR